MINIKQLRKIRRQASCRAIKIHDAMDVPYITTQGTKIVEMQHGKVTRIIEADLYHPEAEHK